MLLMQPDNTAPPFLGFFPPSTDGTLLALIRNSSPEDPEYDSRSPAARAEQRLIALDTLEKLTLEGAHERAEQIVRQAMAEGKPFGIYLRNFLLGARVIEGRDDPYGRPQKLTLLNNDDVLMQKMIAEQTQSAIPFVAIANGAAEPGVIPVLSFSNQDWASAVETLIQNTGAVVMFFFTSSPGVVREFDLLQANGVADQVLIVISDYDPRRNHFSQVLLGSEEAVQAKRFDLEVPTDTSSVEDSLPANFTHRIHLRNEQDWKRVAGSLEDLMRRATPSSSRELPPLPRPNRPSPEALALAHRLALKQFNLAAELYKKGDGEAAENALICSVAFSHWSRDPLGRAFSFAELGSVARFLLKFPNDAISYYFLALDLLEKLLGTSKTAADLYRPLARSVAEFLQQLGDPKRAEYVLDRLTKSAIEDSQ